MGIELIVAEDQYSENAGGIEESYRFKIIYHNISNPGLPPPEKAAEKLIEACYGVMREYWRPDLVETEIGRKIASAWSECSDDAPPGYVGDYTKNELPQMIIVDSFPVREFEDLLNEMYGGSFFHRINREYLQSSRKRSGEENYETNILTVPKAKVVQRAQEILFQYEKDLDQNMVDYIRKYVEISGIPMSFKEAEIVFTAAFKEAIDELGGTDRYLWVRENFFQSYEDNAKQLFYWNNLEAKIAHFRLLGKRKLELYDKASNMNSIEELEKARNEALTNQHVVGPLIKQKSLMQTPTSSALN